MEITLKFPDSCYKDDRKGYDAFFKALQGMLDRMAMSHAKYQQKACPPTMEAATQFIDEVKSLHQRIAMYDSSYTIDEVLDSLREIGKPFNTGNTEWLLDAANMCVIEHLLPKHKRAHFKSTDSSASPNLAYKE